MLILTGGTIFTPEKRIKGNIVIDDGRIVSIEEIGQKYEGETKPTPETQVIPLDGKIIAPGFIDVHIHGVGGYEAMDGRSAIEEMSTILPRFGVVGFMPTGVASPHPVLVEFLREVKSARSKGARILGAHLESSFISRERRGAQPPDHIRPVNMKEVEELIKEGIRMITIAPEVEGALEAIRRFREAGVVVSLGHSNATWEESIKGVNAGITKATHTFNAMAPLNHRQPGCVGVVLTDRRVACEIIADFHHLHPIMVEMIVRLKGKEKTMLVTDSVRFAGLPDGEYEWAGQRVVKKGDEMILKEEGVYAGSVLSMDKAVRNVHSLGFSLEEVFEMASLTPAREVGITDMGKIEVGKRADLVVLDENLEVYMTIVDGEICYKRSES